MTDGEASTKGKDESVETPTASDEEDWSAPIAQTPKKPPSGEPVSSVGKMNFKGPHPDEPDGKAARTMR